MEEECLIPLPASLAPVREVRSTLLQSSLNTLRAQGLFDRYEAQLDPRYREQILGSMAPEWLPIEVGHAHYAACEALGLSLEEMLRIGEAVGDRIQGTFLGTIARKARTVGLTPWPLLGQFARLWDRLMMGGGVSLFKTGPKDARVDIRKLPLARYAYFRAAFCGVISAGIKLGSGRAVSVKVGNPRDYEEKLTFKAAWV